MTYEAALAYIASLAPRGWRLGLDRMEELLHRANLEEATGLSSPSFIHVTGTNGKGSVTAFLQSLFVEQGYRTGAFFSPYVYDPRERVQFGREMIKQGELAALTEQLMPAAESLSATEFGGTTEFEFKTALGFAYWKQKQCDWVALEVGLGGRLDATNVVRPQAALIVSIGLDHTNVLGKTYAEIAHEKAGIIKRGVPLIMGEVPREAEEVIRQVAKEQDAPIWAFGKEIALEGETLQTPKGSIGGLQPGLPGARQAHNMALAVAAMDAAGAIRDVGALASGTAKAQLPGRFERFFAGEKLVILDGAHNGEASHVLRENLDLFYPERKVHLVTGMVIGHEPASFYRPLRERVTCAYVVPIGFHRALPVDELTSEMDELGIPNIACGSVRQGVDAALAAAQRDDVVLVAGSFYLVGEVGAALKGKSDQD